MKVHSDYWREHTVLEIQRSSSTVYFNHKNQTLTPHTGILSYHWYQTQNTNEDPVRTMKPAKLLHSNMVHLKRL